MFSQPLTKTDRVGQVLSVHPQGETDLKDKKTGLLLDTGTMGVSDSKSGLSKNYLRTTDKELTQPQAMGLARAKPEAGSRFQPTDSFHSALALHWGSRGPADHLPMHPCLEM